MKSLEKHFSQLSLYTQSIVIQFRATTKLKYFPFDEQTCVLKFGRYTTVNVFPLISRMAWELFMYLWMQLDLRRVQGKEIIRTVFRTRGCSIARQSQHLASVRFVNWCCQNFTFTLSLSLYADNNKYLMKTDRLVSIDFWLTLNDSIIRCGVESKTNIRGLLATKRLSNQSRLELCFPL